MPIVYFMHRRGVPADMAFGLLFLAILLITVGLNEWLRRSSSKRSPETFKNLNAYWPIFREGWRIVCKNLWIFWFFFCYGILTYLLNLPGLWQFTKSTPTFFPYNFLGYFFQSGLKDPWTIPLLAERQFFVALHELSFVPFGRITWNVFRIPILCLLILFFIKPAKRFLSQPFAPKSKPSVDLLRKNFHPFFIVNACLLLINIFYWVFAFLRLSQDLKLWNRIGWHVQDIAEPFVVYWNAIVLSLIIGYIFSLFKEGSGGHAVEKKRIFLSSLKFVQPLFFFILIFGGSSFILQLPSMFRFLWIQHSLSYYGPLIWGFFLLRPLANFIEYTGLLRWHSIFFLFFMFVPYLIVIEDIGWIDAFRRNFCLLRTRLPQILPFFFMLILLRWLVDAVFFFYRLPQISPLSVVRSGIFSLVNLWIIATVFVFAGKIGEYSKREKS